MLSFLNKVLVERGRICYNYKIKRKKHEGMLAKGTKWKFLI